MAEVIQTQSSKNRCPKEAPAIGATGGPSSGNEEFRRWVTATHPGGATYSQDYSSKTGVVSDKRGV